MAYAFTITRGTYSATVAWTGLPNGTTADIFNTDGFRLKSIVVDSVGGTTTINAYNDEALTDAAGLKDRTGTAISVATSTKTFFGTPDTPKGIQPVAGTGATGSNIYAHFERIC